MANQQDSIFSFGATRLVISPGATLAVLVYQEPYENRSILKYFSGGSLEIYGATYGATATAAQLVVMGTSGGYLLGTTESMSIAGPARYYLMATGATCTAMLLKGFTAGRNE